MTKLKLAILISGRGSNLQALIKACADPAFPAQIAVVISNNPEAAGLARAAEAGIPAMICDHTYFSGDKAGFENALAAIVEQHGAQLVCLAGFMRILSPVFLNRFKDKVINIHPSLLPAYKGLDTHARALAAGEREHGCSVHVVTPEMDEGAVIDQRRVPVLPADTAQTLADRVLAEEHTLYPAVVAEIATGSIIIRQGRIERRGPLGHHGSSRFESAPFSELLAAADRPLINEIPMNEHHTSHAQPACDAESIERSQAIWASFTKASTIAGGAVAVVLVLLAAFLA